MIHAPLPAKSDSRPYHRFTVDEYDKMVELDILTENHRVVLIRGEVVDRATWQSRYRFTPNEYEQMIEHGIITLDDRVERGQGELFADVSIKPPHSSAVKRLNQLFIRVLFERAVVGCQDPIQLADSEPEPDISVMKYRDDFYAESHPRPAEILLVVEVADSSLTLDRTVKGPQYAEAGIVEYWIVNLNDECLEVHRSPQPDGTYADKQVLRRGEKVQIQAIAGVEFDVADLIR